VRARLALRFAALGAALGAALVGVTLLALEGGEVALLRTQAADGRRTETRVWVVDHEGAAWIEAATPERPWYRDLLAAPRVELGRAGVFRTYRALALPGDEGHARIRALHREKYGLADVWVGLLQDTSRSIAVRLEPMQASEEGG
jgi:hypothetical protein